MKTILSYLQMESTWRGLIQLATAAGVALNPIQSGAIIAAGLGAVGLINAFKRK